VSYASSPPAEVIFADPPRSDAPTASINSTCFRQVEFAGVLRGSKHKAEAQKLIDFLITQKFQSTLAENLFVYPARKGVALPDAFTKFSKVVKHPLTMSPSKIQKNRDKWIEQWTSFVR
jgi:thiamine transport system substrate-binding protein